MTGNPRSTSTTGFATEASEPIPHALLDKMPGALLVCALHPDGTHEALYLSPGCRRLFGAGADEAAGDCAALLLHVHPNDRAAFHAAHQESAATLAPLVWEGRVLAEHSGTGQVRHLRMEAQAERVPDGRVIWYGQVAEVELLPPDPDLSAAHGAALAELAATQAELSTQQHVLAAVLDSSPALVVVADRHMQVLHANRTLRARYLRRQGLQVDPGLPVLQLVPERVRPMWQDRIERALAGTAHTYQDAIGRQPVVFLNSFQPVRGNDGRILGVSIYCSEITEQVQAAVEIQQLNQELQAQQEELQQNLDMLEQANQALERSHQQLADHHLLVQAVLDSSPDFILVLDRDYRLLFSNEAHRAALRTRGIDVQQGTFMLELHRPEERALWRRNWDRALGGEAFEVEATSSFLGEPREYQAMYQPIRNHDGQVVALSAFVRDVTDSRQASFAQQQLMQELARQQSATEQNLMLLAETNAELSAAHRVVQQQRRFLQQVMDSTNDWVVVVDPELNIQLYNRVFEHVFSSALGLEVRPGLSLRALAQADQLAFWEPIWARAQAGEQFSVDQEVASGHGRKVFNIHYNPIWAEDGSLQSVSIFCRDITVRRRAELELANANTELQRKEAALKTQLDQTTDLQLQLEQLALNLKQITDNVPAALHRVDLFDDGRFELGFMSAAASQIYDIPITHLLEGVERINRMVHPDDVAHHLAAVRTALAQHTPIHWEGRLVLPSGAFRWIRLAANPVRNDRRGCWSWFGIVSDITRQKEHELDIARMNTEMAAHQAELQANLAVLTRVESELRRSETRLFTLLESIPAGVVVLDQAQQPVYANVQARRLVNLQAGDDSPAANELLGRAFEQVVQHPRSPVVAAYNGRTARTDEVRIELQDEVRQLEVTASPLFHEGQHLESVVVVLQDVTQRKADEVRLRNTEQQLSAVLANYPNIIVSVDKHLRYTLSRGRGMAALGFADDALVGMDVREFNYLTPEITQDYERALTGETFTALRNYVGRVYEMQYTPTRDDKGEVDGVVCISTDITEQQQFTQQLVQARQEAEEAARSKEVFLANMSHEIRTPLNGIIGLTGLLAQTGLTDQQRRYLNSLNLSAENLLVIINDILDFAKLRSGKYEFERIAFSVRRILENLPTNFQAKLREKHNTFELHIDPALPEVLVGDPHRLNQILLNLVSNATKFTEHGRITVSLTVDTAHRSDQCRIQLQVQDTGIGIPPERLPIIFDQFTAAAQYTANAYGGTGLGLSIVRQLVHNMGGYLHVTSSPGQGTTFEIKLDLGIPSTDEATPDLQKPRLQPVIQRPLRVLLVEDHPVNQLVAAEILSGMNCTVDTAEHGRRALELLADTRYDLVLMDIRMPEMDGYQATAHIRQQMGISMDELPIIAMTAHAFPEERERCFQIGMNDYLSKPYKPEQLLAKIARLTHQPEPQAQAAPAEAPDHLAGPNDTTLYGLRTLEALFKGRTAPILGFLRATVDQLDETLPLLVDADADSEVLQNALHKLKTTFRFLQMEGAAEEAEQVEIRLRDADLPLPTQRVPLTHLALTCERLRHCLLADHPSLNGTASPAPPGN